LSSSDLRKGGAVAKKAFIAIAAVGIAEVIAGNLTASVALLADGVHSVSTSVIFLVVWIGISLSGRSPDGTFHFGYYRIQTLGSLVAAFILSVFGGLILVESYQAWLEQRAIVNAVSAIVVASAAVTITLITSFFVERGSKKYSSAALKAGGLTGWLDVLSSVAVVISVILASYFGIFHADSIAGVLIAGAIFVASYSIFKEASLVLVDACKCGDTVEAIGDLARTVKGIKEVHSIRVRQVGPYLVGDMHIVVASDILVKEADEIATNVEQKIKEEFGRVIDIKVRIESDEAHNRHARDFDVKSEEPNSDSVRKG
jgi:cation diffusion facilitator family transporter